MTQATSLELRQSQYPVSASTNDTTSVVPSTRSRSRVLFRVLGTTQSAHGSVRELYYKDVLAPRDITAGEIEEPENFLEFRPLLQELDEKTSGQASEEIVREESEAEIANRTRLELLARQYVSKHWSAEEEARLLIVTERVRRLIPRVTREDFEEIERIAEDINRIGLEDSLRRKRLGID